VSDILPDDDPGDRPGDEQATPFPTPGLPEGRFVELPGRGTTFVRDAPGPDGAPTLLLLHGWTANSALNWFAAYGPLSERFRVLGIDHRGHGHGLRSWRRFTLEDCADDAAALLDALDVDVAVPVGYSMGGPVAQLLWRRHRSRVGGMVLCATAARFRDRGGDRALQGVVTGLSFAARATPSWMHRQVTERVLVSRYDTSPLGSWAREQARLNDLRAMIEAGHAVGSFDSRPWLGSIDVPVAVVETRFDTTVLATKQQAMARAIAGTRVFPVNGGHDVCAVDPDEFVPALVSACDDVVGRVRARERPAV
jgi:pimeloyl-ACP methyl ester carboxylesterase